MRAVSVEVRAVSSRRDRQEFIELPFRLHSTSPQWVPPLRLERHMFLSRRMNAYFKHAAAQEFLATRDGRVVGRISAQIDAAYDAQHGAGHRHVRLPRARGRRRGRAARSSAPRRRGWPSAAATT